MLDLNIFLLTRFLLGLLSFVAFTDTVLRASDSGGCILPWCAAQCMAFLDK